MPRYSTWSTSCRSRSWKYTRSIPTLGVGRHPFGDLVGTAHDAGARAHLIERPPDARRAPFDRGVVRSRECRHRERERQGGGVAPYLFARGAHAGNALGDLVDRREAEVELRREPCRERRRAPWAVAADDDGNASLNRLRQGGRVGEGVMRAGEAVRLAHGGGPQPCDHLELLLEQVEPPGREGDAVRQVLAFEPSRAEPEFDAAS